MKRSREENEAEEIGKKIKVIRCYILNTSTRIIA